MKEAQALVRERMRGFSFVELMVVLGIIGILSAVAVPNIAAYWRTSRIRAGEDTVSGALQRARNLAIMRNTQMGIVFVVQNNNTFWVHVEDTIPGVNSGDVGITRQGVDFAAPNSQTTTRYQLPSNVEFAASSADCPGVSGFTPANASIRFDRYGISTLPPATGDTAVVLNGSSTTVNRIYQPTTGDRTVCLIDQQTRLGRWVKVASGGRVARQ